MPSGSNSLHSVMRQSLYAYVKMIPETDITEHNENTGVWQGLLRWEPSWHPFLKNFGTDYWNERVSGSVVWKCLEKKHKPTVLMIQLITMMSWYIKIFLKSCHTKIFFILWATRNLFWIIFIYMTEEPRYWRRLILLFSTILLHLSPYLLAATFFLFCRLSFDFNRHGWWWWTLLTQF